MKKQFIKIIAALFAVLTLVSCSQTGNNNDNEQNSTASDSESIQPQAIYSKLSDFLTEEQIQLYYRAAVIYPIFRGAPDSIYNIHFNSKISSWNEIEEYLSNDTPNTNSDMIQFYNTKTINNSFTYVICKGKYQTIEALNELCLSVFTYDYFKELNTFVDGLPMFIQINEYLYHIDVSKGSAFGYSPEEIPDTYELISMSDTEIQFNVIGHYKSNNVDPDYTVET